MRLFEACVAGKLPNEFERSSRSSFTHSAGMVPNYQALFNLKRWLLQCLQCFPETFYRDRDASYIRPRTHDVSTVWKHQIGAKSANDGEILPSWFTSGEKAGNRCGLHGMAIFVFCRTGLLPCLSWASMRGPSLRTQYYISMSSRGGGSSASSRYGGTMSNQGALGSDVASCVMGLSYWSCKVV